MIESDDATSRAPHDLSSLPRPTAARDYDSLPAAARALETTQTVLTALILAFIFRAFFVEQFVIPTGSMADSLLGAHARQTCPACGCEYDYAPARHATHAGHEFVTPPQIVCPNCRLVLTPDPQAARPLAGDRILVNKWPYALAGLLPPRRWHVVVFRDPADPDQHYIKRLVGLPGESVEIVDGDVFIDGRIARKPPGVQRALWFPVFDQDHVPRAVVAGDDQPRWKPLDPEAEQIGWSGLETRVIRYDGLDDVPRGIAFDPHAAREYLMDFYAYDRRSSGTYFGDVRMVGELTIRAGTGVCRLNIIHPPHRFTAQLDLEGSVALLIEELDSSGSERAVASAPLPAGARSGRPLAVEFGHVDYRVYLALDGRQILATTDTDYSPTLQQIRHMPGRRPIALAVEARALRLEIRGLSIQRDVHYTRSTSTRRAHVLNPFTLEEDEYFVLGDNSPDSHDSREWNRVGPHLPTETRAGVVRGNQIVGQAAFVYLPGLLPIEWPVRCRVPDLGRVRFVR